MLSRRDKLLVQPWEDRRFKDHRSKVRSALPAIDDRAPAARPHVALKLKKCQRELDRKNKIQSDNYSLLQRLNAIMKVNRLDNHWDKPLPNFQHKVGLFYDAESLNSRVTARSRADVLPDESYSNVKCYACDVKKSKKLRMPMNWWGASDWVVSLITVPRTIWTFSRKGKQVFSRFACTIFRSVITYHQKKYELNLKLYRNKSYQDSLPSIYSNGSM